MDITSALLLAALQLQQTAPVTFGTSGELVRYVVLGDSTAAGVGAAVEGGIAIRTARYLSLTRRVTMRNLGMSGARMRDVLEQQLPEAAAFAPDLVLISAGANDVTHLTPIPFMRRRLRQTVGQLRAANPSVHIVVTGAPDMGSPPRIPFGLRWAASLRTRMVNRMFRAEARKLSIVFAPIAERTGPLFRADRALFHADRFHPNARGYATWIPVLTEGLSAGR